MKKKIEMVRLLLMMTLGIGLLSLNCNLAHAEQVQYTYDTLGRVKTATYPDGTKMTYQYDQNGNIENVLKEKKEASGAGAESNEDMNAGKSSTLELIRQMERLDSTYIEKIDYLAEKSLNVEIQGYNQFKKKKPVIRSLKTVTKNGKLYLKIKIKRLQLKSGYKEQGYEIKYATNKKFKNAKTEKVTRDKKKKLTTKTWKVKKNKTYYVKVRAYMKTKKGKKIYSKYSVVKKITVNP